MNKAELMAFALGYYDGREKGTESKHYDDNIMRHLYRMGYDAGVTDYSDSEDGDNDLDCHK